MLNFIIIIKFNYLIKNNDIFSRSTFNKATYIKLNLTL